jgi:hypothetical protein
MTTKTFTVEFEFVATRADGDPYTRTREIKAKSSLAALAAARTIGFAEFGERFTENCIDWRIK